MASDEVPVEDLRCRFCLAAEVDELIPLFCVASTQNMLISHMAIACTGIVISSQDKLPQYTCDQCLGSLDVAYSSWKRCRQSWGNYTRNPTLNPDAEDFRCRICLEEEVDELISLYCICENNLLKVSEILKQFAGLDAGKNDTHPQHVCNQCLSELNAGFEFRKRCLQSFNQLKKIESSEAIVSIDDSTHLNEALGRKTTVNRTTFVKRFRVNDRVENSTRANSQQHAKVNPVATARTKAKPPAIKSPKSKFSSSRPITEAQNITNRKGSGRFNRIIYFYDSNLPTSSETQVSPDTPSTHNTNAPAQTSPAQALLKNSIPAEFSKNKRQLSFSSPAEFKQLAKKILEVPKKDPNRSSDIAKKYLPPVGNSRLVIYAIKPISRKSWCTSAKVCTFRCKACRIELAPAVLEERCANCKLPFNNYQDFKSVMNDANNITIYCCNKCSFYSTKLLSVFKHSAIHEKPNKSSTSTGKAANLLNQDAENDADPLSIDTEEKCVKTDEPTTSGRVKRKTKSKVESHSKRSKRLTTVNNDTFDVLVELDQPIIDVSSEEEFPGFADESEDLMATSKPHETTEKCTQNSRESPNIDAECFKTLTETNYYITVYFKGFICCGCMELFNTQKQFEDHRDAKHINVRFTVHNIMCDICMTNCKDLENMASHRILAVKKIFYYCKICKCLLLLEDFETHRETNHSTEALIMSTNLEPSKFRLLISKFNVGVVLKKLILPLRIQKHVNDKSVFELLKETKHLKLLDFRGEYCCGCQLWFDSRETVQTHREDCHLSGESDSDRLQCEWCRKNCINESVLARHRSDRAKRLYYFCKICRELLIEQSFDEHCGVKHLKLVKS